MRQEQSCARNLLRFFLVPLLFTMAGCGAGRSTSTAPPSSPAAAGNHLAGNWLLVGNLPTSSVSAFPPTGAASSTGFALSVDVTGNQITAAANVQTTAGSCGSSSVTLAGLLSGTLATDGTFLLSTPTSSTGTLPLAVTVGGTVPSSTDGSWKGSYTFASTGLSINGSTPCSTDLAGSFTATPIQDVDGNFVGSGTYNSIGGNPLAPAKFPVTIQLTLHQGGTLYSPRVGASVASRLALTGSVLMQGLPCFSQGSTSTTFGSLIEGNRVEANFLASDGTAARVTGELVDTDATQISIDTILVQGAQCNAIYDFLPSSLIVQR